MHTFSEFQQLHEVMQQPQPWKWSMRSSKHGIYNATFETSEGEQYYVNINRWETKQDRDAKLWAAHFEDADMQTELTDAGQPFEVFATVLDIVLEFIDLERENIDYLKIDASKQEQSRVRLYDRMVRKYKPRGWKLEVNKRGTEVSFILSPE